MPEQVTDEMVEAGRDALDVDPYDMYYDGPVRSTDLSAVIARKVLIAARAVDPLVAENERLRTALIEAQSWMERAERVNGNWSRSSAPLDLIRAALEAR